MSEIKVNKISPKQTCTQLTLGDSGDTIIIPAGATITNNGTATGFGATGAVNWDTTKKTSGFTAVNGVGYFCDTTSAAFTVTLPSSPSAGAIIGIADYAGTFATNNLTINRNSSNIGGSAVNAVLAISGNSVTFVYVDSTQGWIVTDSGNRSDLPNPVYIAATGGTTTTCGNYKIHTFTGPGTFCVSNAGNSAGSNSVEYLVVAGGGGTAGCRSGGGGAGGFRQNYPSPTSAGLPVSVTAYPITVGSGGAGSPNACNPGTNGNNSIFSTITSTGGGRSNLTYSAGSPGGSGGGGSFRNAQVGGTGNTPPVSPPQGNPGGISVPGDTSGWGGGGGGGGASVAGGNANACIAGAGGAGTATLISGSSVTYAGGGGGGVTIPDPQGYAPTVAGPGGAGGGGAGNAVQNTAGNPGTANRGGGGGGASNSGSGGSGGSGIVIIRYRYQ